VKSKGVCNRAESYHYRMYLHAMDLQILQQSGNILTNVPPQISFLKA